MSSDTYKASKEAFVADGTGSSITHVNLVSIPAVVSLALYAVLRARLPPLSRTQLFALSFTTLVVPLLLALTLFSHAPVLYSTSLLCLTLAASLLPKRESGTPLPSLGSPLLSPASSPGRIGGGQGTGQEMSNEGRRSDDIPALTVYRAHMLLMTALCILAVDFPIFPRMLAKCETWGASLMDIGVGSFVFSQGLAVAHPIVRNPSYLNAPLRPKLVRATRKALPVLALGLVRVLLVKGTDYPEHVTEYGVHWNFFLTLGLLPIMQTLFHPIIASDVISIPTLGILIVLAHQLVLTFYLQDYVLDSQRNGLFGMNKEGVVSLPGYLALHILGLACGTAVLPPSPSAFRRMRLKKKSVDGRESEKKSNERERKDKVQGAYRENDKTATVLFSWSCIYWSLLGLCTLLGFGSAISRRMANAPYILWTAAYNTTFLLAYVLLDLVLFPSPLSASVYDPVSHLKVRARVASMTGTANNAPALLVAINRNGLAFFLVANLATGAVNLTIRTMYADDTTAMGVLGVYAAVICAFAWATKDRRLL